ncbi:M20/M25/M40 family metallo-hydrolase, partial [Patescibacteria group bacterium]|nr:M20/M25/M40 family metallo-hydrolase [Patescibacteria group bacterium]
MKSQILKLSQKLIKINSTKKNSELLRKVLELAKKELDGFKCRKFVKNGNSSLLFYNTTKFPKKFKILLNAHLDVVSGKKSQFRPYVKNGKLYGRGALDMKSASTVMILIYKKLANKINYPIGLQIVTDEETGGFNGTKHQIEKGVKADFVIAGESTDFNINNKAKGIIWAKITVKGITAHGAYLWKGINAIEKMNSFINKLYKEFPTPNKEVWETTVNVAKIETTNKTFNKIPDKCILSLDVRYIPKDEKAIIDKLRKILPKDFKLEIKVNESCQFTKGDNSFIRLLQSITKKVTKKPSKLISQHGGADIRHFNKVGCAGVSFGPIGKG